MTAEAAHWAVETWALALGFITQPLPVAKPTPVLPPSPPPAIPKVAPAPLLRTAEPLMAGRYRDNGDGTVTDVQTGLQWMRFSLGQEWKGGTCTDEARKYTWQEAFDAAETLNRQGGCAGYRGWRVPTKEELQTLISGKQSPTIDRTAFPDTPAGGTGPPRPTPPIRPTRGSSTSSTTATRSPAIRASAAMRGWCAADSDWGF
jgi:hypothetical protein